MTLCWLEEWSIGEEGKGRCVCVRGGKGGSVGGTVCVCEGREGGKDRWDSMCV